jgi:dienelactone hydrolase
MNRVRMNNLFVASLILVVPVILLGCSGAPLSQSESVPTSPPEAPSPQQPAPVSTPEPSPTTTPQPEPNELPVPNQDPLSPPAPKPSPLPEATPEPGPVTEVNWKPGDAPAGVQYEGANWIVIQAPQEKTILAVYFTPQGDGPFPVVVFLHGTVGFRETHVQLAQEFAANGFVTVAGSWFGGHYSGMGTPVPTQPSDGINWPNGPDIKAGGSPEAVRDVVALINAARTLPAVDSGRVGLFGHSRGSVAALSSAASGIDVQAVVAVAGYPERFASRKLEAPVLLLQGTADNVVSPEQAEQFEAKLIGFGKNVTVQFIEGAPHQCTTVLPWSTEVRNHASSFYTDRFK